jgi:hypothetical protein
VVRSAAGGGPPWQRVCPAERVLLLFWEEAMARIKITATGLRVADNAAIISVFMETASWMQGGLVRVPLDWLTSREVTDAMDRAVRRRLIERWSEVDLADPLF